MANTASQSKKGSFVLMLHSHLPYYRKAGMWPFGEENLYECMMETYLPLLNALYDLKEEGIKAGTTVGITPILAEQLDDEHLKQGFVDYLTARLEAVKEDVGRYPDPKIEHSEHMAFEARWYVKHFEQLLDDFNNKYHRDLIGAFKKLQDEGCIEITTSAATHGFLPLLGRDEAIEAQLKTGIENYKRLFGQAPKGIWLPECAYRPGKEFTDPLTGKQVPRPPIESFLYENGIQYFFTEFEAIEGSDPSTSRRDFSGVYRDIKTVVTQPKGKTGLTTYEAYYLKDYPVAVLGRNERASFQVWSAEHGYPGDGLYREFHKKDVNSGMHYWRITSKDADFGDKMLYDPIEAFKKAEDHANHYVGLIRDLMNDQYGKTGEPGLLMVSFDTELYGHWWFEGVHWLKQVIKGLHQAGEITVESAGSYLANHQPDSAIRLPESTWGMGGHFWVWDNDNTNWMWPIIHQAEARFKTLVDQYPNETDGLKQRALNQALRELLLLEGSDWPFLVTTMQAKDYAVERFNGHVDRFNALCEMLEAGEIAENQLAEYEEIDNPFAVDYRWYAYNPQVTNQPVSETEYERV